jgi:FAT domain
MHYRNLLLQTSPLDQNTLNTVHAHFQLQMAKLARKHNNFDVAQESLRALETLNVTDLWAEAFIESLGLTLCIMESYRKIPTEFANLYGKVMENINYRKVISGLCADDIVVNLQFCCKATIIALPAHTRADILILESKFHAAVLSMISDDPSCAAEVGHCILQKGQVGLQLGTARVDMPPNQLVSHLIDNSLAALKIAVAPGITSVCYLYMMLLQALTPSI